MCIRDSIIRVVIALIQEKLPRYVDAKPFEIQVLTPMRKGLLGVERLNQILQRYLNPPEDGKSERAVGDRLFRTGDKVMQIRNNYQMEWEIRGRYGAVSYTHLRAHETDSYLVCRLLLEKKKTNMSTFLG